jgi:hypothetical protein
MANTPWGLCSADGKEKDSQVAQDSLSASMDDNMQHILNEHMKGK